MFINGYVHINKHSCIRLQCQQQNPKSSPIDGWLVDKLVVWLLFGIEVGLFTSVLPEHSSIDKASIHKSGITECKVDKK